MIRENRLKQLLRQGRPALGCWLNLASPIAAEIAGLAGFDCVMIDHEHGPGSLTDGLALLQALSGTPATALMRVPWNDPVYVKRALDLGVEGLMFPSINSAAEAQAAVRACRYPPGGTRGIAYGIVRATDYGLNVERYRESVDENFLIICQIETVAAVAAIPEIAAVPGVDMLFIGPNDLSGSVGRPGQFDDSEVAATLARAERAILDSGCWYGGLPYGTRTTAELVAAGCRMVLAGSDIALLRKGAADQVAAFRQLPGPASGAA
ncbi:MAG: hypothetical protein GC191_00815 [Azospirillum sp.]|nr:hypothetical protein [Azospirillum sp.]